MEKFTLIIQGIGLQFGHGFTAVDNGWGTVAPGWTAWLQFGHGFTAVDKSSS